MVKYLPLLSILVLATLTLTRCDNFSTINLNSQIGETRNVDLSSLGIPTNQYQVTPPAAFTDFTLVQPIQNPQSTFTPQFQTELSSYELQLGNGLSQKAQIFVDDSSKIYLAFYSIQIVNQQTFQESQITQLASSSISNLVGLTSNPLVTLYSKGNGFIVSQGKITSTVLLVSLDNSNSINLSAAQTQVTNSTAILSLQAPNNDIYYISYQASNLNLDLYQISNLQLTRVKTASLKVCQQKANGTASQIKNSIVLAIRCVYTNSVVQFEEYSIDYVRQLIIQSVLTNVYSYTIGTIISASFVRNSLQVIEIISAPQNPLQLTTLENQISSITSSSVQFEFSEDTSTIIGAFLSQDASLITIVTFNYIIGLSVSSQNTVFKYSLSTVSQLPSQNYNAVAASQYGTQILITFANSQTQYGAASIYSFIPTLSFAQDANPLTFSVQLQNDPMNKILEINSTPFSLNPPISLTTNNIISYYISTSSQSGITIPLDQFIFGSNLALVFSNFVSPSGASATGNLSQYSSLPVSSGIPISQITQVFSSKLEMVLVQRTMNVQSITDPQYFYSYESLTVDYTGVIELYPFYNYPSNYNLDSVDSFGSFTLLDENPKKTVQAYFSTPQTVASIQTLCDNTSTFLFSSDINNGILATTCQSLVTVYYYNYNSAYSNPVDIMPFSLVYPYTTLPNIQSIQLNSNGILVITDNLTVYGFDVINKIYLGNVAIPQSMQGDGTFVILFANSFICATSTNIYQMSYNNFNGSVSTTLRQLLEINYTWEISAQNLTPSRSIYSDQEYLLVASTSQSKNQFSLVYRLDEICSQNQLLTAVPIPNGKTMMFLMPNLVGYFTNSAIFMYEINYNLELSVIFTIQSNQFEQGVTFSLNSQVSLAFGGNLPSKLAVNLIIQRDVSAINGQINNNSQVQTLSNYFTKNPLQNGAIISFQDSTFFNANLFGWQLPSTYNNIGISATIQQRAQITQTANPSGNRDMLQIMDGTIIYATNNTIFFINNQPYTQKSDAIISLYLDPSQSASTYSDDKQLLTQYVVVYALIQQVEQVGQVSIVQMQITGNYEQGVITSFSTKVYEPFTTTTDLFLKNKIVSITTDPILNLIALIQPIGSQTSAVYQLILSNKIMTLNSATYQDFTNLQIVQNFYFNSANVFFTQSGYAYYNYAADLTTSSIFNLKQSLINLGLNLQQDSILTQATQLIQNGYLFEFDGNSLIYVIFSTEQALTILSTSTLYQQNSLFRFTGIAYTQNQGLQIIVVYQVNTNKNNFGFMLFEPFDQTSPTDYLIKTCALQTLGSDILTFRIATINESTFQVLAQYQISKKSLLLSLSVQSSVEISVTTVSIPNGLNGNAFGISPLSVFPSPSNTIMFALNSNSDTPSAQGRILRACFFALAIMLIIIG